MFTQRDGGEYTTVQRDDTDIIVPAEYMGRYRDPKTHPMRWNVDVPGSLGGAGGTFRCGNNGDAPSTSGCRVTNQNNHFHFEGPWMFTPLSATSSVRLEDGEFMYFGWWARQLNETGAWTFRTFHGPMGGNRSTAQQVNHLGGTATYRGPAVGQYSFYQPLTAQSDYGEFSATATLMADFGKSDEEDDGTVHGTIDQFDQHPDWTLTLKHGPISTTGNATTAQATDGVSWKIDGEAVAAPDSGSWEAAFYSDLPAAERGGTGTETEAVPTGIAGTFEAKYKNVGAIIGAFGAHKQP